MIDCLLIGFNDIAFDKHVQSVRALGESGGAWRDLNLAFITHANLDYRAMDLMNLYRAGQPDHRPYSNVDFLWPVITYLHSYLTRRGFVSAYINLFQNEKARLIALLDSGTVKTVAITTTLYVWSEPLTEIIELVRHHAPTTRIVVGGPYVHNQVRLFGSPQIEELFDYLGADIYVVGPEGESTLVRVLEALRAQQPLDGIDNLIFRDGRTMVRTTERAEDNSLEAEMTDYGLFPASAFNGFVSLRTAKSCPFACSFCAFPGRAGGYSYLPVWLIEKELDAIRNISSVSTLSFIDDTFNVPKTRFKEILRMMIRRQYGFRWNSYLRSDHVDAEAIELMARSGCEGVFLGVESGSDRILRAMNKTARRANYLAVIPQLRDAGILTHANIIVGFPGETSESIAETMNLIETTKPDFYRAQLWYCDPTTPVWQQRQQLGIQGAAFSWTHSTMSSTDAADWVETFFSTIRGSIWLPQYGFEQWSLYYLQRRGMPLEQLKQFIIAFNSAVLSKLRGGAHTEATEFEMEQIRGACQALGAFQSVSEVKRSTG